MTENYWIETYRSMISISMEAIKFLALINGGASVALLAFLGNIYASGRPVPDMRCAMVLYAFGLFACGLSFATAYFTQLSLLNEIGKETRQTHAVGLYSTVALFLLSLILFAVGSVTAAFNFG